MANDPAKKLKATDPEYQIKALEEGVKRARNNIRLFEGETERQKLLKKEGKKLLKTLKSNLKEIEKDKERQKEKLRIMRLEDNIERNEKNIEIYSAEAERQRKLRSELEIQLQALKVELKDEKDDSTSRKN